ncbi:MAG: DNA gyrase subunit A [Marinilabiliaceae bacterium]|nr:DNA gyrase subunit A [Marinilabiliaceae bacterium]
MIEDERIIKINIEDEMKSAYIDYSMSVIVSRALPDVRDGLKPVHRRVLFGMNELGVTSTKAHKKSARIVGDVLGKYHPHGDSSVYNAMVRMAQEWSLRYPLVDGQGNFGSMDGDSPAAMRYTEARLSKISEETLVDIEKETVDFQLNFDDTLKEPTVLPTKIPLLLINGASGIAVGMATNMAPHNLADSIDAITAFIDNPQIEIEELISVIKAPDFPTGGIIYGYQGVKQAYLTGRGRVVLRAKTEFETDKNGRNKIVATEIPYNVNKAELIKKIADLTNEKKIDGISDVNDETDRHGMRIVVDLKKDAIPNVVLNHLFKHTEFQSSFSVNNIALVKGRPRLLNLKEIISCFVEHRHEVVTRRTQFELRKAEERLHILEGLIIASDNIDEVIRIIRAAETPNQAIEELIKRFQLTEIQARAIVEMRLRQLTGLEQEKLRDEHSKTVAEIARLKEILEHVHLRMAIIKQELLEIKEKYKDERRTEIVFATEEINPEDFYADDEMVITISHLGYIKRTPLAEFKTQNRGGVGSKGSSTRDEDFIEYIYPASMHHTMLFFTKKGLCFWLKVYQIPEGTKSSKGRAIQNLLNIDADDAVKAFIRVKNLGTDMEFTNSHYIVMATKKGLLKKTLLSQYSRPRQNGVYAIVIREGDELLEARLTNGRNEIIMATLSGRAIRFNETKVRSVGRKSMGVKGVTLSSENDEVVGMVCIKNVNENILVVSEKGYGKCSKIEDYRITNRGGKGIKTMRITPKTGNLISIKNVSDDNDLMIINKSGITIRLAVANIRVMGRATMGVRLINLDKKNDEIASVAKVASEKEEEKTENILDTNDDTIVENNIANDFEEVEFANEEDISEFEELEDEEEELENEEEELVAEDEEDEEFEEADE